MGKFPNSQVCCRHLRPDPYHDSHCVAAALVSYDTRLSVSLILSQDTKSHERTALLYPTYLHETALCSTQDPDYPGSELINAVVEAFENT